MFRLWHIIALIAIGALMVFTEWLAAQLIGLFIIGLALGIGLGTIHTYRGNL